MSERTAVDTVATRGVAVDAVRVAQLVQAGRQPVERGVVVERAAHEPEVARQPGPDLLAPRGARVLHGRGAGSGRPCNSGDLGGGPGNRGYARGERAGRCGCRWTGRPARPSR